MLRKIDPGTWVIWACIAVFMALVLSGMAMADPVAELKAENKILWYLVSAAIGGLGSYMVVYGKLSAINAKLEFLEKHHTENTGKIAKVEAFGVKNREDLNNYYSRLQKVEKHVSNQGGKI